MPSCPLNTPRRADTLAAEYLVHQRHGPGVTRPHLELPSSRRDRTLRYRPSHHRLNNIQLPRRTRIEQPPSQRQTLLRARKTGPSTTQPRRKGRHRHRAREPSLRPFRVSKRQRASLTDRVSVHESNTKSWIRPCLPLPEIPD